MKSIAFLLFLIPILTFAQRGDRPSREEIEAERRAFITEKLDLSVEEAEKFWPLYNEMHDKLRAIKREGKSSRPKKPIDEMSDEEVEALMKKHFELKQRELDIEKEYAQKFKSAIPVKKIAKLPMVEEEFKKLLLRRMRGGGHGPDHHREGR